MFRITTYLWDMFSSGNPQWYKINSFEYGKYDDFLKQLKYQKEKSTWAGIWRVVAEQFLYDIDSQWSVIEDVNLKENL